VERYNKSNIGFGISQEPVIKIVNKSFNSRIRNKNENNKPQFDLGNLNFDI
jgi:hypothetical protein